MQSPDPPPKLTARQEEFLTRFFELCGEYAADGVEGYSTGLFQYGEGDRLRLAIKAEIVLILPTD